jgi:hypothetical protein
VPAAELVADVVLGLRLIAKLPAEALSLDLSILDFRMNLDQAIAVALYFAAVLPPFLDHAKTSGTKVAIIVYRRDNLLTFSIAGDEGRPHGPDPLRDRLVQAYVSQLGAHCDTDKLPAEHRLSFAATQTPDAA